MKKYKKSFLSKEIKKYAMLTTGTIIAMSKINVKAAVVYVDVADTSGPITFDGDVAPFYLYDVDLNSYYYSYVTSIISSSSSNLEFAFSYGQKSVIELAPNSIIDAGLTSVNFSQASWSSVSPLINLGGPENGTDFYIGWALDLGGGDWRFGWARLNKTNHLARPELLDYAYESTPNTPIVVGNTLPVEFTFFKGMVRDNQAILDWQTASELDNKGFGVQRSVDGMDWEEIGFVTGHGTSTEIHNYQFIDEDELNGRYYYRLRQLDYDGVEEFSSILSLNFEGTTKSMKVFPNPISTDKLNFSFNLKEEEEVRMKIYDTTGKVLQSQEFNALKGFNQFHFDIQNLAPNIYFIRMEDQRGQILTKKFIVK